MTIYDVLLLNVELLKKMYDNGINTEDYMIVKMFGEYLERKEKGEKISYIVATLSEKYGMSERTIYRRIKHLQTHCHL